VSDWTTARFADGPAVAAWLEERGIVPSGKTNLGKRVYTWRAGSNADIFTLDQILCRTPYGLWELPESVWLEGTRSCDARRPGVEHHWTQRCSSSFMRSRAFGCSHQRVADALREHGVSRRPMGGVVRAAA